jgi:hypothetical protein
MITRKEEIVGVVAVILDHPSLYMGGPSRRSLAAAKIIVQELEDNYGLDTE